MKDTEEDLGTRHFGPTPRQRLTGALELVQKLYAASDKPSEAAKWRKELEESMVKP